MFFQELHQIRRFVFVLVLAAAAALRLRGVVEDNVPSTVNPLKLSLALAGRCY